MKYRTTIAMLLMVCSAALGQDALVWVASPWEHVRMGAEPGPGRSIEIRAARNEYESFRIIVRSGSQRLADVGAVASALTGPTGEIPAENIKLFREHYVDIFEPSYRSKAPIGWYPDALIPFVDPVDGSELAGAIYDAVPFAVDPERNQGLWGDVYVPKDAVAGEYTGKVTVTAAGTSLTEVPIKLTVWGFALPDTIAMRSNFGGLGSRVAKGLGMDAGSEEFAEVEDLYVNAMLTHRCIPSSLGRTWPEWTQDGGIDDTKSGERLRMMVEDRHMNALRIPFRYRGEPEKCKAYLRDLVAYLREKGWLELGYIYMRDEPNNAEQYETVRKQGVLIHEAAPGIKRLCTEQTISSNPDWGDLYGAVDIWCPLWGLYDEATALQRQELGEEIWSYTALCQRDEKNPFWQIDFPPVSFRAPFWVSWHYDIKGFLYWSSVYWTVGHDVWTRPHFRDKYWGEGMLLYPGDKAGIKGPVTSIRLKLVREAMEDFEYMTLAAARGHKQQVDAVVDGLARSFTDWERYPAAYARARRELAELITTGTEEPSAGE